MRSCLFILLICGLVMTSCANRDITKLPISTVSLNPTPGETMTPTSAIPELLPELQPISAMNAENVQLLRTMKIPGYTQGSISQCNPAFSPDGKLLVGACGKNLVPVWDVQTGNLLYRLYETPLQIVTCSFSPDGKIIACGGFDKTITLWDTASGRQVGVMIGSESPVWELAFSPDGKMLASCSISNDVRLWDLDSGNVQWSFSKEKAILSVAFDPAGNRLAFGGRWGKAGLLDVSSGEMLVELVAIHQPIGDITFSPSGKYLAAGTDANSIYLWDAQSGQTLATLTGHRGYVNGVSFDPDETLLVSGSHDGTLGIWDVAGQKLIRHLEGHTETVLRVAFNPAGTLIASISWDGTVRLWGVK